jgi:MFS family permease
MYQTESASTAINARSRLRDRATWFRLSRNVVLLGVTSFITDISSEMVASALPYYLLFSLRMSPVQYGVIDGLYQGASAWVRLIGGLWSDKTRRHKEVATLGYALSAMCKLGFLLAGNAWAAIASVTLIDRIGKGIRTAPRDALIAASATKESIGFSFGAHRAMDTAGAMLGPLIAFGLLTLLPNSFDALFVVSFCLAIVGVSVIGLFVNNVARETSSRASSRWARKTLRALLQQIDFRALVVATSALGLFTISDGFLFFSLHRRVGFSPTLFPLLYVVTASSAMILSIPFGRLADRVGRLRVYFIGHAFLILVYASLLADSLSLWIGLGCLLLLGAFYAATDGVLAASASAILPEPIRASGLATLSTFTSLARMLSSVVLGWVWSVADMNTSLIVFLCAILFGVVAGTAIIPRLFNARQM